MTPVLDEQGNQVYYTEGAMNGKPKHKISHERKYERLNLYIWLNPCDQKERLQNKNTIALAEKIRYEREQEFLEDERDIVCKRRKNRIFMTFSADCILKNQQRPSPAKPHTDLFTTVSSSI